MRHTNSCCRVNNTQLRHTNSCCRVNNTQLRHTNSSFRINNTYLRHTNSTDILYENSCHLWATVYTLLVNKSIMRKYIQGVSKKIESRKNNKILQRTLLLRNECDWVRNQWLGETRIFIGCLMKIRAFIGCSTTIKF